MKTMMKTKSQFGGKAANKSPFGGNGMSRTAMLFKIATLGGVKLTVPQLNKIKDVNPRQLEHVYDEVVRMGDQGNARFALSLILK